MTVLGHEARNQNVVDLEPERNFGDKFIVSKTQYILGIRLMY